MPTRTRRSRSPGSRVVRGKPPSAATRRTAGSLTRYHAKRDFTQTREPAGANPAKPAVGLRFVIQKHDASQLHYDFRLKMDGVLRSWAVPNGVPFEPGGRHLAVEVEDHPIEYGSFEGTIPAGNYGAGTVALDS
jgi:bifunctional non-homologous end joining protein LigD